MLRTLKSYTDYWIHRKRFTTQYATATFISYLFSIGSRTPHRIVISRKNGNVWMPELTPGNLLTQTLQSLYFAYQKFSLESKYVIACQW